MTFTPPPYSGDSPRCDFYQKSTLDKERPLTVSDNACAVLSYRDIQPAQSSFLMAFQNYIPPNFQERLGNDDGDEPENSPMQLEFIQTVFGSSRENRTIKLPVYHRSCDSRGNHTKAWKPLSIITQTTYNDDVLRIEPLQMTSLILQFSLDPIEETRKISCSTGVFSKLHIARHIAVHVFDITLKIIIQLYLCLPNAHWPDAKADEAANGYRRKCLSCGRLSVEDGVAGA
ncbi:MAG: hypothetical protein J3Q66DRAFT_398570 [Benniella sp.]|nr:MAG: hypothetical protein J3Q66DRAFT_398570 [Benniella sp.]